VDGPRAGSLLTEAEDARERIRSADDGSALADLEGRYAAMREAMDWFLAHSQADEAYRFASALMPFWMATKRLDEGAAWFADALERSGASRAGRARALYEHGHLAFFAGDYALAESRFADARELATSVGDMDVLALSLTGSARVALNDDLATAIALLRRAIEITGEMPDSAGRSNALHVLGVALQMSGDLAGARAVMRERLERGRAQGSGSVVFIESSNLSMVERKLGNLDEAEELSRDALVVASRRRNELAIPWVINGLAAVTAAKGNRERAATLVGIAESLLARAGGEWPADEREQYESTLKALGAEGAESVEERRAEGRAMSLEDGVAFALSHVS
jgi:tetratricopeptide (TPR) repeat protein